VQEEAEQLQSEGFLILGTEVTATVPGLNYSRRYDLVVMDPVTETVFGVEVKTSLTGSFQLDPKQVMFDVQTVAGGAASEQLPNVTISGVMYRGICWGCGPDTAWRTFKLVTTLNASNVPFKTTVSPIPGGH